MNPFAFIGFAVAVFVGIYLIGGALAGIRFAVGFTGRWRNAIPFFVILALGIAVLWLAYRYAPFVLTISVPRGSSNG